MKIYKVTEQEAKEHILAATKYGISLREIELMIPEFAKIVSNYKLRQQAEVYYRALKELEKEKRSA